LLGQSGSGKTTLLRLIAGLEKPTRGTVENNGDDITKLKPEKRDFGMVFQSHALFPHLNVADNIAFGLKARKLSESEIKNRVGKMLSFVRLSGYENRRIEELSGGEQQRVAIARALAIEPKLLLFDEPFSNLDVGLREKTRSELRDLIKNLGLTAVYVTHDQQEAFDLCDRIGVLDKGQLLQIGTPREIYEMPESIAVASFLGNNNLFQAMRLTDSRTKIHDFRTLTGNHAILATIKEGQNLGPINKPVTLAIRPEDIKFFSGASFPGDNILKAAVIGIHFSGATTTVKLDAGGLILEALVLHLVGLSVGDEILVGLPPDSIKILAS
jgi:ABC-type Fe3+/spermidine/putrescine transport system ATPase subunit